MKFQTLLPLLLVSCFLGCSANSDSNPYASKPGNNSDLDGGFVEASTPEKVVDASPDVPSDGFNLFDSGYTGDGAMTKDSACATETVEAEEIPIDLFIMADSSGSMSGSGWQHLTDGLNSFFTDSQSKGLTIALSFFPADEASQGSGCTSKDSTCSGTYYYKPQVDWGLLPGHAAKLAIAISKKSPTGCTPTQDALNGLLRGCRDRQKALKDHVVAGVIVSDGEPCCGMCPIESAQGIGQIAYQYANPTGGDPPIRTFSIYVTSEASDVMDAIAKQGGTKQAYDATKDTKSFIKALDEIRAVLLACEYKMPVPEAGLLDPSLIAVEYTAGNGDKDLIPRIDSTASCGSEEGWQYDDDANPTRITLCPVSCDLVQEDPEGRIDILVGCATIQR